MHILSESNVQALLAGIDGSEVVTYQKTLLAGLLAFYNDHSLIPQRIVSTTSLATHLFMVSTGEDVGVKALTGSKKGLTGALMLVDKTDGALLGIVNAGTLTAFRTSLASSLSLVKVFPLEENLIGGNLICYGVGPEAEWHLKVAILLYPGKFDQVVIVNRTVEKAAPLVAKLKKLDPTLDVATVSLSDKKSQLEAYKNASVVYSCIPATSPTVLEEYVEANTRPKLFIGAIGSYKPHMIEVEGSLIKNQCLAKGGKVIVDSAEHCLAEAGEFIQNDIGKESLVEVASLYLADPPAESKALLEYIKNEKVVISKLVGLCIMDVTVGARMVEEAKAKKLGTEIEDF